MDEMLNFSDEAVLPSGFRAAGTSAGIKKSGGHDMAMLVSDVPAMAAGVFTRNRVNAAPVKLCRERLRSGRVQAVVVNSGNANACTGAKGLEDAYETSRAAAAVLGISKELVMVSSTGTIGTPLPMEKILAGVKDLAGLVSETGGEEAACAILTTDTRPKRHHVVLEMGGRPVTLVGMCKGAGMIEPNMATMLCYILTDAAVEQPALQDLLADAVERSFNRISVDGDMSTNDSVIVMANGKAGNTPLAPGHADWPLFEKAVKELCLRLAVDIVADGEGAGKVISLKVSGAKTGAEADRAVRAIANSFLVKTSWTGNHPHWGRLMDVLGYCGIEVDENAVDIFYDDLPAALAGTAAGTPVDELKKILARHSFTISIDLHLGDGQASLYTCECTEEYVRINL